MLWCLKNHKNLDISVVIPLLNEKDSLEELCDSISEVMVSYDLSYEIILIDDGSIDKSWSVIEKLSENSKKIKGIKFKRNYGKSQALHAGFLSCQGDVVLQWMLICKMIQKRFEMYDMIVNDNLILSLDGRKKI